MGCVKDDHPVAQSQKCGICQDETRHHVGLQAPLHSETLTAGPQTSNMVSVFPPILPSVQRNVFTITLWILLLWRGLGWRVGSMDCGVGDG